MITFDPFENKKELLVFSFNYVLKYDLHMWLANNDCEIRNVSCNRSEPFGKSSYVPTKPIIHFPNKQVYVDFLLIWC